MEVVNVNHKLIINVLIILYIIIRVGELLHRLLNFLRPFLDHPYHNVRSRLGAVLNNIFCFDLEFPDSGNANKTSPHEKQFVEEILARLECLREDAEDVSDDKAESARRLLQTLSKWVSSSVVTGVSSVKTHMFR